MVRMFEAYRGDHGTAVRYLHVFIRIETYLKWASTRLELARSKKYTPDTPLEPASESRPELGNKKAKAAKLMAPVHERLQSSIDVCISDANRHAEEREENSAERWKEHFQKQDAKIELLKSTAAVVSSIAAAKKRNTDLAFLLGGNTAAMDSAVLAWYLP